MDDENFSQKPVDTTRVKERQHSNYRGYVAGACSGFTKCIVGHPFDTIKVRLQTTDPTRFKSPLDCLLQTVSKEGISGIFKGVTPPLIGWVFMDSIMLGSLAMYRNLLENTLFSNRIRNTIVASSTQDDFTKEERISISKLPIVGHGLAGIMAGATVSYIAAPIEHIKARLQVQYSPDKLQRQYKGPLDCAWKIYRGHGVRGLYHGLTATLIFRTFFFFWWSSYEMFTRFLLHNTNLNTAMINFLAGGVSAQVFWLTSYPSDVVKQRIMTQPLGENLHSRGGALSNWSNVLFSIYREKGIKGYWRGFLPCILRAFPANAMALVAFEGTVRALP